MAAPPLIRFDRVAKIYGKGETEVRALDGVSLTIGDGEFVAIMGPSGSGKSTAMNILGCLDTPTSGRYEFRGIDVGKLTRSQRALLRRNYIGFVFQGFNLLKRTTARENLELPLIYRGEPAAVRRKQALRALDLVGLGDRADHTSSELSGGQQQRVAIARAFAPQPSLLLADEPTGNLDGETGQHVIELLFALHAERGTTLLLITHDPALAARCDRIIHLRDGNIVEAQQ